MWRKFLLLDDAPADGGNPNPEVPKAEPAKPPPAADTVLNGEHSERELQLQEHLARREKELAEERDGRKKDQVRLSELEDENHRLRQIPASPASAAEADNTFRWPSYNV